MVSSNRSGDPYLEIGVPEIKDLEERYLFSTYKRYDLVLSRGSGCYVFDPEGNRYLDFLAGIAVNSLGHNHPRLVRVIKEQVRRIIHTSNLYYHPFQGQLAKRLVELSGMSRVFFTNSGTEAIEAALKVARAHARMSGAHEKTGILTLRNSFHGRTFGALSITAQEKYQAPFRPLIPEVAVVQEMTIPALESAFSDKICALVVEPIQGEGGVNPLDRDFLIAARELCTRFGALLVFDEIQCGMGRTGKYFAYQHYGILPDMVTLAKSLAAGYPLGALLGNAVVAQALKPGDHGTTFGGGPLACRIALEVLDIFEAEKVLEKVADSSQYLLQGLNKLAIKHHCIKEVRGLGLMIGVEMGGAAKEAVQRLQGRGILANAAHDTVLRLLPPLIISRDQIDQFLLSLADVLEELSSPDAPSGCDKA
jgi:acetylornithine/N-succinyldiaminopimelate aminotransferase